MPTLTLLSRHLCRAGKSREVIEPIKRNKVQEKKKYVFLWSILIIVKNLKANQSGKNQLSFEQRLHLRVRVRVDESKQPTIQILTLFNGLIGWI